MAVSVQGNTCNPCRVNTTTSGCLLRLPGECVYYSGSNISGPGINTGDTLNITVNKLVDYINTSPGSVTSVGLVMPFGFTVTGSPVTGSGTLTVSAVNEWVSVTDYGAVGNGIADDTVPIQDALFSGATTILFPQGTYLITSSLLINSNTTLFGYGATIVRSAAIDNMLRNNADGVTGGYTANENIKILGLAFNGNGSVFTTQCTFLAIGHARNIVLKDCEFYNIPIWHGTEINGCQNVIIENCSYHDGNGEELLQFDLMAGTAVFPWFGPYDNTSCRDVIVHGCSFYNGTGSGNNTQGGGIGSHSGGNPNQHSNVIWSNNTFRNLHGNAMKGHNYRNLLIIGNVVDGCRNGVTGNSSSGAAALNDNYKIIGNTFINCNMENIDGRGILMFFIKDVVISGNNFSSTVQPAVELGTCDRVVISDNMFKEIGIIPTIDVGLITLGTCNDVKILNNTMSKSSLGFPGSAKNIELTGVSARVTIDDNTITTVGATSTFSNILTTPAIVGTNIINTVVTPFISNKTLDYIYTPTDSVLNVDTALGNVTITINPSIFNKSGLTVRKTTGDANTVTITPSSGTINGLASISLTTLNEVVDIKSDWVNLSAS